MALHQVLRPGPDGEVTVKESVFNDEGNPDNVQLYLDRLFAMDGITRTMVTLAPTDQVGAEGLGEQRT